MIAHRALRVPWRRQRLPRGAQQRQRFMVAHRLRCVRDAASGHVVGAADDCDSRALWHALQHAGDAADVVVMMVRRQQRPQAQAARLQSGEDRRGLPGIDDHRVLPVRIEHEPRVVVGQTWNGFDDEADRHRLSPLLAARRPPRRAPTEFAGAPGPPL